MRIFIIGLVLSLVMTGCAWAGVIEIDELPVTERYVRAIIGEAEGEGQEGMMAVACGIRNRPERLEGVNGATSHRYFETLLKYRFIARFVWRESADPDKCAFLNGADMWCSDIEQCNQVWKGVPMHYITKIGNHYFYRRITTKGE